MNKQCIICGNDKDMTKRMVSDSNDSKSFYKYGASVTPGEVVNICSYCADKVYEETNTGTKQLRVSDEIVERVVQVCYACLDIQNKFFYKDGEDYMKPVPEIQNDLLFEYLRDIFDAAPQLVDALLFHYRQPNQAIFYLEEKFGRDSEKILAYVHKHIAPIVNYYGKYYATMPVHKSSEMKAFD